MSEGLNWDTNLSSHATHAPVVFLQERRQSRSNAVSMDWKERIYNELKILIGSQSDDFELNEISALRAKGFIRDLPLDIDSPALSAEDGGSVLIEWYKKPRGEEATIFSVVFGTDNYLFSLLRNGTIKSNGALNYSDESLEMIFNLLRKNFGIISNARSRA